MAFQRITPAQRSTINALRDRAWAAGLTEATFSQIAKNPATWEKEIQVTEDARAAAERGAAQ
jgi:hypothetical protein